MAEPEDMFSPVDDSAANVDAPKAIPQEEPQAQPQPASALSVGVLKPKVNTPPAIPKVMTPPMDSMPNQTSYPAKGPVFGRILITLLLILILGGLFGGGGWFVYTRFIKKVSTESQNTQKNQTPEVNLPAQSSDNTVAVPTPNESLSGNTTDTKLLFGEPVDSDGDGLTDDREKELGTDPTNWDTDHDGLSDYDEVTIWKTDPKNPDTDGDTYQDGAEVKNGYNPAGPGKIFEPPTPKAE
jgi:hypothetical protein